MTITRPHGTSPSGHGMPCPYTEPQHVATIIGRREIPLIANIGITP